MAFTGSAEVLAFILLRYIPSMPAPKEPAP